MSDVVVEYVNNVRERKFSENKLTGDFPPCADLAPNDIAGVLFPQYLLGTDTENWTEEQQQEYHNILTECQLAFREEWDNLVDLYKKRYTFNEREVFLLYTDRKEKPIETFNDVGAFEITSELLMSVCNSDIIKCYEDSYAGDFYGGAIEIGTVQIYENEQRLVTGWVGVEYAKQDLAHRELAVSTDNYYDWTSERTKFIERHADTDELDAMGQEWAEICHSYGEPFDGDDISFAGVLEERNEMFGK